MIGRLDHRRDELVELVLVDGLEVGAIGGTKDGVGDSLAYFGGYGSGGFLLCPNHPFLCLLFLCLLLFQAG